MVYRMIFENIMHRPIRTLVSILAVAIEVGMVMLVVGMTHGMLHESAKRVEGVGADIMVQPSGASLFLGMTQAPMPVKIADRLAEIPHVLAVAPVLCLLNTQGRVDLIYGVDMPSFDRVSGGFVYLHGGPFTGPYSIMVDDLYAKAKDVKVGKTLNFLNHNFQVTGIVMHGKGARLFIPLATAQDLTGSHDKASIFYVRCTDPGYTKIVSESIRSLLPKNQILSIKEYMSLMTSNEVPALNTFVTAMVAVAVGIGFLVIFLSMYTTITERTREIGILKSLGAGKGYIIQVILWEASLLSILGIIAGYAGTWTVRKFIIATFPTLPVELTIHWALWAGLLAMGGSLLGAFYPAIRAARLDPVDSLAYE
ncbi:MAG TPA: FtsX-like permease family protein [Terriglobia bacterium]|nr:FtsX-like permease family protein [Terriglobia bacterium]